MLFRAQQEEIFAARTGGQKRSVTCNGKYERGEAIPSIDAAKKIADSLEVSLDYLVGEGIYSKLRKKALKRLQDLELLEDDKKKRHSSISSISKYAMLKRAKPMRLKSKKPNW